MILYFCSSKGEFYEEKFFKRCLYFLASVLTVGMCSAYSVNAKAKFSLPKKTTLSYDKKIMARMVFTQM